MRTQWIAAAVLVCQVGTSTAQTPAEPTTPNKEVAACLQDAATTTTDRFWFTTDYLLWRITRTPIPTPLVTSGSPNDALPGVLGQPNTHVLYGQDGVGFGHLSGLSLNTGFFLDDDARLAVEGGYFGLERRSRSFSASSNANGDPVLGVPVVGVGAIAGAINEAVSYDDPTYGPMFRGGISVDSTTRFQGWEVNASWTAYRDDNLKFALLAGFRTLDLNESLTLSTNSTALQPGILTFLGNTFDPPGSFTTTDQFHTYDKFYGGQVGTRIDYTIGRFDVDLRAKVALGDTQEVVLIEGASSLVTPGSPTVVAPGGILALPGNIGRHYHDDFTVVPEVGLNIGYRLTRNIEAHVGYSALYWNKVLRPGAQVDGSVTPSLIPTDQGYGTAAGAGHPLFTPRQTDFWAQGVNLGLEVHF